MQLSRGGLEPEGDHCPRQEVVEVEPRRVQRHLQLERRLRLQGAGRHPDRHRQRTGHRVAVTGGRRRKPFQEEEMSDVLMMANCGCKALEQCT